MQRTRQQRQPIPSLSSADIQQRIQRGESNDYESRVGRSYWEIFRDNVLNLFNLALGGMLVAVVVMGDYATAIFAGFSVVTNTFFGMLQEFNAKRQLDQLAALAEQTVRCRRDENWRDVPMREVVKDEIIHIQPGDRLVVDGVVLQADSLELDESQLTGESDAVAKAPDDRVFSGSFCTAGTGIMRATQVGTDSQVNRLSAIAKQYKLVKTPTQIKIDIAVEIAVLLMMVFVPMIFVAGRLVEGELLYIVRDAVVFTTSLVPQGLVLVAILSLTIGAVKISMQQTLIQRVNAVESLANATTLCFDKTGTLTQNKLAVDEIMPIGAASKTEILRDLHIALANMAHHNNTAQAIAQHIADSQLAADVPDKLNEIPFNSARKWSAVCLAERTLLLGAPERLLPADHAHAYTAEQLSQDGLRVLAFAQTADAPDVTTGSVAWDLQPLALIVMSDQIRSDIQDTLAAFRAEGLTLKVISGDNLETVRAIAGAAGMDIGTRAYSGAELEAMGESEFASAVAEGHVFARIEPDTKQRIVAALRANGEYVAMVGDGVNDVPALKAADLAIVMNDGTQISKDVADIVLLNNAMSTLPRAFGEGKATTQTIFGTMKLFLVRNFYMVALFVFIAFMALPFPITPVQISWATFGTVNLPATLIAFGWLRPQPIKRFRRDALEYIFTMGFIAAVMMTALYLIAWLGSGGDLQLTRSVITVIVALYGLLITWQVQGIDLYEPRTFVQHWRIVLLSSLLTVATILSMYAFPDLFEFSPPLWDGGAGTLTLLAIPTLFVLTLALVGHGLRHRYLLERFWALLAADREE
ncbi:MAG: HAD-IC family P-type ATPase [Chloroflexi bacterium]|nr:HAD-IC family P-type ATPase [Chloroflexota bacterium]MCY4248768.1 HAD-IC family P-type ATPase [Chloroflexota bacterium]